MPGSGSRFGANEKGEHAWIDQSNSSSNKQQFCRTHIGWPGDPDVATVLVGQAFNKTMFVSVDSARRLKTVSHYGSGTPGLTLHTRRDYLAYMQRMIEAGKRAGFIVNDVDIFTTPITEEVS